MGQLGEWPVWYTHERNTNMREMWRDTNTGEMVELLHEKPPQSSLSIGEWGAWEADVTGEAGDFVLGILPRSQLPIQSAVPLATESRLVEGAAHDVTLTRYERNEAARLRCIAHYGPECQACGLRYEAKYGPIGADLIHVHHVTPLSAIGESYDVDPVRDLIPLCATCHHVTHRRDPPYSVQELKAAIAEQAERGR